MFGSLFAGVQHLQNIHPLFVHFPIAFLVGATLLFFLAWIFRSDSLARSALSMLILGVISAAATVATGEMAADSVKISPTVQAHLLEHHEDLMVTTLCISIGLLIWALIGRPFPRKGRVIFLIALLVMLGVMSVGADYGARMVYDYNIGGKACSQPLTFTK
jgi:uncharacterized membrane protein